MEKMIVVGPSLPSWQGGHQTLTYGATIQSMPDKYSLSKTGGDVKCPAA